MIGKTRRILGFVAALTVALSIGGPLRAGAQPDAGALIPQIDSSTARIPITGAIYDLFANTYGMSGPAPICSKTHGAWLNLADGAADIIFLVAPTQEEFDYFAQKGTAIEMKVYGYDGLVFLGNQSNAVDSLTPAQIRAIYSGKITNWKRIPGGRDSEIVVYIRNPESGSQRLFQNLVWTGYDMPDFASSGFREGEVDPAVTQGKRYVSVFDDMGEVTQSVMVDRYAIGFNIMSYVDSEFLNPSEGAQSVRATGEVNLRTGPGLGYGKVGAVSGGTTMGFLGGVQTDERGVDWYQAERNGREVWISSRYARLDNSAAEGLKLFSVDGYAPTTENFASGAYPFVTTSYVAIRADEPEGSPARTLYNWLGSEESRALIAQNSTLSVAFSDSVVLRAAPRDVASDARLKNTIERLNRDSLARSELYDFSEEELGYLCQGVYALSGKMFHQEKYAAYFGTMAWYRGVAGTYRDIARSFNQYQSANLSLLSQYLKELRRANANRADAPRTIAYAEDDPYMRGEDVSAVQRALAQLGYIKESDCDGVFGRGSARAVASFQADNVLPETGVVDADTRLLLVG